MNYGRRKFLNTIGAATIVGTTVSGFSGKVQAAVDTKSAEEAEVADTVSQLAADDRYDEAIRLLDQHDVTYSYGHDTHVSTESDGGISTADFAQKDKSEFSGFMYVSGTEVFDGEEHDIISVRYSWDLNFSKDIDTPVPVDAVSIYWESNIFGLVSGSVDHGGYLQFRDTFEDQFEDNITKVISPNLANGTEGVGIEYNDTITHIVRTGTSVAIFYPEKGYDWLELDIRRQIDSYGNIRGEYGHNWCPLVERWWNPSNISLNIGSFVSYNLPNIVDQWTMSDKQDI